MPTSTSPNQIAADVLARCLAGEHPADLPPELLGDSAAPALFGILAEGLADRFEPALCDAYAHLFSQAIDPTLEARYQRIRTPRAIAADTNPSTVYVLSRITLGADIAVTSVVMDAAKQRFPRARIVFAGPRKNYELFAGDPRIEHLALTYPKGTLRERLAACPRFDSPDAIVLDPDSRLTQLGLLPVCDDDRYRFFESRAYHPESTLTLPELTAQWTTEVLGVAGRAYWQASEPVSPLQARYIAISLGVAENQAKRLPDPFEQSLLALLASTGRPLFIDRGAGGPEADRVEAAARAAGIDAIFWNGSFAGFAEIVAASALYVGYDSAGQHAAAARGIPSITVFAGFPCERFFDRWRPHGPASQVIRVVDESPQTVLARIRALLHINPAFSV